MAVEDAAARGKVPWIPLGLFGITFLVHGRVISHAFLLNWDDLTYVLENDAIRGFSWRNVQTIFGRYFFGNYAPLHLLSYALDYSVWGLRPAGFLLTNVLLHAANGCLLFYLLLRLGLSRLGAAFAAALFLVHPVQVESVAWVSERKNLLCMTFSLASLHLFVTYRNARSAGKRWMAYGGAFLAFAGALLTKAIAVVVPPILLLVDRCHVESTKRRHWILDKVPFALAAGALVVATVASQKEMITEGREVFRMGPATTVFTMVPVVVRYVGMVFWPARLSAVYTPKVRESADLAFWGAAALVCGFLVMLGLLARRRCGWAAWCASFFVALVPVLHIVPLPTLMNDRYLYFPMLGASVVAGMALQEATENAGGRRRLVFIAFGALLLTALGVASFVRAAVWRDDVSLWRDATEKTPDSSAAWVGLGMSLVDAGRPAEAMRAYQRAIVVDPFHAMALNNLGALYNQLGDPDSGRPFLLQAVRVKPDYFEAFMNLGIGFRMSGDLAGAERAFASALSVRPQALDAMSALRDVQRLRSER